MNGGFNLQSPQRFINWQLYNLTPGMNWVQGVQDIKTRQIPNGVSIPFFDSEERDGKLVKLPEKLDSVQVMYVKTTTDAGVPCPIEAFAVIPIEFDPQPAPFDASKFVPVEQFNTLTQKLDEMERRYADMEKRCSELEQSRFVPAATYYNAVQQDSIPVSNRIDQHDELKTDVVRRRMTNAQQ